MLPMICLYFKKKIFFLFFLFMIAEFDACCLLARCSFTAMLGDAIKVENMAMVTLYPCASGKA